MSPTDLVIIFYKALAAADIQKLSAVLSKELDWWFHGPPLQQHLMRMLTGVDRLGTIAFVPLQVDAIDGEKVIVEGRGAARDDASSFCWVHVSVTVSSSTASKEFGWKQLPGLVLAV